MDAILAGGQMHQEDERDAPPRAAHTLCGEPYNGGQDHLLPMANVGRIMRKALPPNAKISKEAKEAVQECASEFIGFVTGEAADRCHRDNRKAVSGDDICHALQALGLDRYGSAMTRYLSRFKEQEEEASANVNKVAGIDVADELSMNLYK